MAKVIQPLGGVQASGTVEGNTYSRWRGINTVRRKSLPANPGSAAQTAQRNKLQDIIDAIRTAFADSAIRLAWTNWAGSNTYTDSFTGNSINLPAYQAALKVGLLRLAFGGSSNLASVPSTVSPSVPDGVTATGGSGTLQVSWGSGTFAADTSVQIWYFGPHSTGRNPNIANAKLGPVIQATTAAHAASDIVSSPVPGQYTVWCKVFDQLAPAPAAAKILGTFTVT